MNYKLIYDKLIDRGITRNLEAGYEKHHIIPKCMGGDDSNANLVKLTPEEHYVAHQLLVKIYPDSNGLKYAVLMMTLSTKKMLRNNKSYGWIRRQVTNAKKGSKLTDSTKLKISNSLKGLTAPKKVRGTPESKQRMSDAQKGKKLSEETKAKMGRPWSEERKRAHSEKIKQVRAQKKWVSRLPKT